MRAVHVNLRRKREWKQVKVGHKEEESSLNRSELAVFVLALRDTIDKVHAVLLRQLGPSAVKGCEKKWIGEGGKAMLSGAPHADCLLEVIKKFQKGRTAGTVRREGKPLRRKKDNMK